jgi:hypothetical protein
VHWYAARVSERQMTSHGPVSDLLAPTGQRPRLHVRLLCHFEGVINLDAEIANRTFQLDMSEQQLHGAEVLCPTIDQRSFSPPERVRPVVRRVQSQLVHPGIHDPWEAPIPFLPLFEEQSVCTRAEWALFNPQLPFVSVRFGAA